ncbi:MAG: 50S ribosomal protein L11 methyltransferase [Muribaculaceae bacterium]|nr:50S ribosomal protein L11 methyltransferase [Muribaculaceae bacterium]
MNDYIETRIDINPCDETATDILASLLCDIGYESFVPDATGTTAYIKKELFDKDSLDIAIETFPLPGHTFKVSTNDIEGKDWNAEWERNYFKPIVVDGQCIIHSSFHKDIPEYQYDIVIDPKMAFGTGHHATTSLIIYRLLHTSLDGLSVIDMGTGTGILAILAAMKGASPVNAIEIDPFAQANAVENVRLNNHPEINVILGDADSLANLPKADIFIANINRNIILNDMGKYAAAMKPGASILLSGFYEDDVNMLLEHAQTYHLEFLRVSSRDRWACLELQKAE